MPNRMFGLVEASAWMHVRNGTFKMRLLFGIESDSVPVSLLTFSAGREKVKSPKGRNTKLINLKQPRRAQTRISSLGKSKAMHSHGGPWERGN